ncbi:MAG: hypothetical protein U0V64_15505 [Cyclobacteriaceae bacterium]
MRVRLYDIIMNVCQVDESDEGDALIENKLLVRLNKEGARSDKYIFDFFFDDIFENESKGKVNTRLELKGEMPPDVTYAFYVRLNFLQRALLSYRFGRLWFQKKDNLQWLLNLLVAGLAIYVSWIAIIKNDGKNEVRVTIDSIHVDSVKGIFKDKNEAQDKRIKMIEEKLQQQDTSRRK